MHQAILDTENSNFAGVTCDFRKWWCLCGGWDLLLPFSIVLWSSHILWENMKTLSQKKVTALCQQSCTAESEQEIPEYIMLSFFVDPPAIEREFLGLLVPWSWNKTHTLKRQSQWQEMHCVAVPGMHCSVSKAKAPAGSREEGRTATQKSCK